MGHARKERVKMVGTRSADYIRASGHSGCVAMGQASTRKQAAYMAPRTLRRKSDLLLQRGHRPYMALNGRTEPKARLGRYWVKNGRGSLGAVRLFVTQSVISAELRCCSAQQRKCRSRVRLTAA